ncbi:MAG TPA: TIGR03560 family F420-dependent LLM class oxidoreductase [Ktedonobacterales bacterium]
MARISLMIEGQNGLTWAHWKRLVSAAEELGFAGLFRSDHFTNARPPDKDSLETIVSLTYAADNSQRIHFGPLVAPLSFRHPALLARQAAALDDLSGGRMILGLGAGWQEREHTVFGLDLGDIPTRMARFEEGLEVITRLLRSDEPVTFEGRFYRLQGAILLPRPQRPGGPPILIGGNGPKRTLPLVARYANVWNAVALSPEAFRESSSTLDHLLLEAGRKPEDVARTLMLGSFFGRDEHALDRKLSWRHDDPELAGKPLDEVVQLVHTTRQALVGTPDQVIAQLRSYIAAGAQEIMVQWLDLDDMDGLRAFATSVPPHV